MSLSVRWHRLDASAWVYRLLMLWVAVLGVWTAVTCIGGLPFGAPLLWLIPAALTALAGWLAHAWGEERRWTWWVVLTLVLPDAGGYLLDVTTGPSFWRVARLLLDAVLLILLAHPDSTARLRRPAVAAWPRWVPGRPPPD